MNELEQALIGDSAAAPPAHILEGIQSDLAHRVVQGAPHTIYQELWHIAFWQQVTLEWVNGIETPFPTQPDSPRTSASLGISCANASSAIISRPRPWRVTRRDSSNPSVVLRGRAIRSASCQFANNWRAWRPTMLITSGGSSCFASSVEHGHLPLVALAGDLFCTYK